MDEQQQLVVMQLIMAGGNAKGAAVEAIRAAKAGDFTQAETKLKEADQFINSVISEFSHRDPAVRILLEAYSEINLSGDK